MSVAGPKAKTKKGTSRWCEFPKIHVGISAGLPPTAEDDDTNCDRTHGPLYPGLDINNPGLAPITKLGSAMQNMTGGSFCVGFLAASLSQRFFSWQVVKMSL